jgi:hypothetical protein
MANTYNLIEAKTLSSTTTTVSFTSIPATYTDLLFSISARSSRATQADNIYIGFNSSTSNFTAKGLIGVGTSGTDNVSAQPRFIAPTNADAATASTFGNVNLYIPNYTSSNYKSYFVDGVSEDNAGVAFATLTAGLWSDAAAITSVEFTLQIANYLSGSTFYLYGIKKN